MEAGRLRFERFRLIEIRPQTGLGQIPARARRRIEVERIRVVGEAGDDRLNTSADRHAPGEVAVPSGRVGDRKRVTVEIDAKAMRPQPRGDRLRRPDGEGRTRRTAARKQREDVRLVFFRRARSSSDGGGLAFQPSLPSALALSVTPSRRARTMIETVSWTAHISSSKTPSLSSDPPISGFLPVPTCQTPELLVFPAFSEPCQTLFGTSSKTSFSPAFAAFGTLARLETPDKGR